MPTPTVRRLQLGNELRHLREKAGLTLEAAGVPIERSQAVMSRLEHGVTGFKQRDLRELLQFYNSRIPDETIDIEWYLELNKGADQRGRWTGYRSTFAKFFRMAVDLEADAAVINWYEAEVVPGLLQTENYIRAMFNQAGMQHAPEGRVRARLDRREVLVKDEPPVASFVLSESCLRRMVGTPEIMREQLAHLIAMAELPNVHIHIVPFRSRASCPTAYPFTYFRVPSVGSAAPLEFIYVESYHNGEYLDDPEQVTTYTGLWGRLLGAALDVVETRDTLERIAQSYE